MTVIRMTGKGDAFVGRVSEMKCQCIGDWIQSGERLTVLLRHFYVMLPFSYLKDVWSRR